MDVAKCSTDPLTNRQDPQDGLKTSGNLKGRAVSHLHTPQAIPEGRDERDCNNSFMLGLALRVIACAASIGAYITMLAMLVIQTHVVEAWLAASPIIGITFMMALPFLVTGSIVCLVDFCGGNEPEQRTEEAVVEDNEEDDNLHRVAEKVREETQATVSSETPVIKAAVNSLLKEVFDDHLSKLQKEDDNLHRVLDEALDKFEKLAATSLPTSEPIVSQINPDIASSSKG